MKRSYFIILGLIIILLALLLIHIFITSNFDPNSNPQEDRTTVNPANLSLPFSTENSPESMVPMGETIKHPDPPIHGGHPGIDFRWRNASNVKILASMDGIIYNITKVDDRLVYMVSIKNGVWGVDCEVENLNPDIKIGQQIKRGDYIGSPTGHHTIEERAKEPNFGMIHWQFGYAHTEPDIVHNRLCPMNYFDNESKKIIEELWAKVPDDDMFKSKFSYICSGYYYGRNE